MIHRYIVEFNIEQNHVENDPLKFLEFLRTRFSPDAKLELIRTGKADKEYSQGMPVMVTATNATKSPAKGKSMNQQLQNLTKVK